MNVPFDGDPRRDAELVAWLLDEATRRRTPRAELEGSAADAPERLEEWDAFLRECRAELSADERAAGAEGLAARILARTTREDVSWRGDLRLVRGFLAQRLRSSVLLRVVAASLLVHIAALPVLAYYTFVAPEPTTVLRFDPAPGADELPFREDEPERGREVEAPAAPGLPVDGAVALPGARELYRERLRSAGYADLDGFSERPPVEQVVWNDPLTLSLRVEQLLDEAAAGRPDPERLAFAVSSLERELRGLADAPRSPALRAFLSSTWLRARAAGAAARDEALAGSCRRWLGSPEPLTGARWLAVERRAAEELRGR